MKKILFLTTSPVSGGNGDALIDTAMKAVQGQDIMTERINVREKIVNPCKTCYRCATNGDSGYTFFDTAEVYGTVSEPHHNELLLGEILKPYRNQIKIASKCGLSFDESSQSVNKALYA